VRVLTQEARDFLSALARHESLRAFAGRVEKVPASDRDFAVEWGLFVAGRFELDIVRREDPLYPGLGPFIVEIDGRPAALEVEDPPEYVPPKVKPAPAEDAVPVGSKKPKRTRKGGTSK
jgi:hypothetical protein